MKCSCGICGPKKQSKPTQQPCRTCIHYSPTKPDGIVGFCESILETVGGAWRGCVRHKINPNMKTIDL